MKIESFSVIERLDNFVGLSESIGFVIDVQSVGEESAANTAFRVLRQFETQLILPFSFFEEKIVAIGCWHFQVKWWNSLNWSLSDTNNEELKYNMFVIPHERFDAILQVVMKVMNLRPGHLVEHFTKQCS